MASPYASPMPGSPRHSRSSSMGSIGGGGSGGRKASMGLSDGKSLGVYFTGYLDKLKVGGWRKVYKRRFVVLTSEALHWFKRPDGYDLFGEERGRIGLENILEVAEDRLSKEADENVSFQIQNTKKEVRVFKCESEVNCEEWITAIRSAIRNFNLANNSPKKASRRRLSAIRDIFDMDDTTGGDSEEVHVTLVSLKRGDQEIVLHRKVQWARVLECQMLRPGDELVINLSNGGCVNLDFEDLMNHCDHSGFFDCPVNMVTLASSVNLRIYYAEEEDPAEAEERQHRNSTVSFDAPKEEPVYMRLLAQPVKKDKIKKRIKEDTMFLPTVVLCVLCNAASMAAFTVFARHAYWHMSDYFDVARAFYGPNMPPMSAEAQVPMVVAGILFLCVAAFLLGIWSMLHLWRETVADVETGVDIRVVLLGHAFVSPDEPARQEEVLPQRFIDGTTSTKEARQRWAVTKHWREKQGADRILHEPNEHFETVTNMYPHWFSGVSKEGHRVYYERPGELDLKELKKVGVGIPEMLVHWLLIVEYEWRVLCEDPSGKDTAKGVSVIDLDGVAMSSVLFGGDAINFLKMTIGIAGGHYPERSANIALINVPNWFGSLWNLISGLIQESTRKKVKILARNDVLEGLRSIIDDDQIPEYYGGSLRYDADETDDGTRNPKDSCRWYSPEQKALFRWMRNVNRGLPPSDDPLLPRPHGGNGIAQALPVPGQEAALPAMHGNGDGGVGDLFGRVGDGSSSGGGSGGSDGGISVGDERTAASVTAHMTPVGGRNSVRRSATTAGYGGLNNLNSPGPHRRSLVGGAQNSAHTMTPMSALTTPRSMPGSGNDNSNNNCNSNGSGGSMLASDDFSVSSATTAGTSPLRSSRL